MPDFEQRGPAEHELMSPEERILHLTSELSHAQSEVAAYRFGIAALQEEKQSLTERLGVAEGKAGITSQDQRIIKLEEELESLRKEAGLDTLTGAPNRLGLAVAFNHLPYYTVESRVRSRESEAPKNVHSLALIDLDHFKEVNDTYGHPVGDAVLRSVVHVLRDMLRNVDTIARLGGDEFAVLLPNTFPEEASSVLDRARILIGDIHRITLPDDNSYAINVGASIGVTKIDRNSDFDTVYAQADSAMYIAKNAGRNRIHIFGQPIPRGIQS